MLILVAACTRTAVPAAAPLPFFGPGYRFDGDFCRRLGEDAFTNQFLDDAADLIACPSNAETLRAFVADTGAIKVAERAGYLLFSVPNR